MPYLFINGRVEYYDIPVEDSLSKNDVIAIKSVEQLKKEFDYNYVKDEIRRLVAMDDGSFNWEHVQSPYSDDSNHKYHSKHDTKGKAIAYMLEKKWVVRCNGVDVPFFPVGQKR